MKANRSPELIFKLEIKEASLSSAATTPKIKLKRIRISSSICTVTQAREFRVSRFVFRFDISQTGDRKRLRLCDI